MTDFLAPGTRAALNAVHSLSGESARGDGAPLERLRAVRALLHELEADPVMLTSVRAAVEGGSTWDEIAEAAGLKPAAARWRWAGTDEEISARLLAGRKRSVRPSSVPTDLPGLSVAEAAAQLGVSAQAVYLQVSRGKLTSQTVQLDDGRSYKRVFLNSAPTILDPTA
ncbi:hypothetical protein [Cryobacterium sp. CG_9.6]|uniref:hypothetical protein n=1 Tax=Cryobacterium sp. CG_9.6 TaxID=2760710 RepID=UPI0024765C75|nr:hypothetical protein [Cryobacterium sp. CG_9.6]MDH6237362.1 DNA-directed RNA polymerase specialized sigma24 family protein [Cryobacterium sp. CG_9.6]